MAEVYVDSASLEEIEKFIGWGIATGVTTNQKIFLEKAKGCNFEEQAKKILQLVYPLPVSLEGPNNYQGILDAADRYTSWRGLNNVVIKVPMLGNGDGLRAVKVLSEKGIKTNVTACMTLNQTFLAACAGATYVSLFYNRMRDWKYSLLDPQWEWKQSNGIKEREPQFLEPATEYALDTIDMTMELLEEEFCETKLIIGSIRSPLDIEEILTARPHIITIPTGILEKMPAHSATDAALKDFDKAWAEFCASEKKL